MGEDVSGRRPAELAEKVGVVFQDFESQLFSTSAELDAAFGPENLGLDRDEIRRRVDRALEAVGMKDLRGRDPATLSGGQKQRLAIASVLSLEPKILCLDEPVTDLDPDGRREVGALIEQLCRSGMTVLIAEHELDLLKHADRVVALDSGKIALDSPARECLADPEVLARFGVRPGDLTRLAIALGLPRVPEDPKEAAAMIREAGYEPKAAAGGDARPPERLGPPLIKIESLEHVYPNGVRALSGVDLEIEEGEFVALLGRNGSGKTTLAKHLNGLLKPTGGAVLHRGEIAAERDAAELGRKIGYVFQDPDHQIFAGNVFDEVAFAPRNQGLPEDEVKERVEHSLALMGLADSDSQDPFLMTKGERQRVAIASILAAAPETIVMDEPTTGLDYAAQAAVMDLLAELNRAGETVVVITHTMWAAAEYASRFVLMVDGEVLADGGAEVMADRGALARAGLVMPEVMEVGLELGCPAPSVSALLARLERSGP